MPARNPSLVQPHATTPGVSLVPSKPAMQSSDTKSSRIPPALSEPTTGSAPKPTQNARPPQLVRRPKQPPSLFIPKKVRLTRTVPSWQYLIPVFHLASSPWRWERRASQQKASIVTPWPYGYISIRCPIGTHPCIPESRGEGGIPP